MCVATRDGGAECCVGQPVREGRRVWLPVRRGRVLCVWQPVREGAGSVTHAYIIYNRNVWVNSQYTSHK